MTDKAYISDKLFERKNFDEQALPMGEYEQCTFTNCNFSGVDLSGLVFSECNFSDCNLSLATMRTTALRDIQFNGCKLLGLHFDTCNPFLLAFGFRDCVLDLSSFYRLKLKKTTFSNCSLQEADLTEADLTGAVFNNCDLGRAKFENTILEQADLSTAFNYSIDPELNRIRKAKFAMPGVIGLLNAYDIEIIG